MLGEHTTESATISELLQSLTGDASTDEIVGTLAKLAPETATLCQVRELLSALSSSINPDYVGVDELGANSIDCCGTGGSGISHFNTSTAVAFVLAANDVPVVKFGNRAASSQSGSFDFLDALGVPLLTNGEQAAAALRHCHLVFLSAASTYPLLLKLAPARRALGKPTMLNFVGPLLNPARPTYRLLGISNAHMQQIAAEYLETDGRTSRALVVRSSCGLDEFCVSCSADVIDVPTRCSCNDAAAIPASRGDAGSPATGRPLAGNHSCMVQATTPGSIPKTNAARLIEIFSGNDTTSTAYELIIKNAAAGLTVIGGAADIESAATLARRTIASGQAMRVLENVRSCYAKQVG